MDKNFRPWAAAWIACTLAVGALVQIKSAKANDVFTVGNYPVEATASNAVEAKNAAIDDGQNAALKSVLKRLAPVTYFERLRQLKLPPAADLLESVRIRSERNSSTDYIAEIDIKFNADSVRALLRDNGVPFVDQPAPRTTVVAIYAAPVKGAGRDFSRSAGEKLWREVWLGLDLENAIAPSVLERLKPSVHRDTLKMVLDGTGGGERILRGEYGTDRVMLAIVQPDPSNQKLRLTLAGTDAVGPIRLVRDLRFDPQDFAYAMELAAVITQGILDGRWKAVKLGASAAAPPATGPSVAGPPALGGWQSGAANVPVRVIFQSIADWRRIRLALEGTPGVSGVDVNGLTPRAADVTVNYSGSDADLANAVAQQGLQMQPVQGGWVLR